MSGSSEILYVGVRQMIALVHAIGLEHFLTGLVTYIEEDFRRWPAFTKSPRIASHSPVGVIELMPANDSQHFAFKYVNGHPKNTKDGKQTVIAFGVLSDVTTGYPVLLSEMTLLTALRTAATSALVSKHLAPENAKTLALIGNGAQSEFQALALKAVLGIDTVRLYDSAPAATKKCAENLANSGLTVISCPHKEGAVQSADIITTCTADKQYATILTDNMVKAGIHINAIGGDCPGKTEIHKDILLRTDIFVEYEPQTRIEGDIQQLASNHPVTEFWQVLTGEKSGRTHRQQTTLFDGVGFAIEDFSALRFVNDNLHRLDNRTTLDLLAAPNNPRNLYDLIAQA